MTRAALGVAAAAVACGAMTAGLSPARAEGFFDSIRQAIFGRIVEVRPSYAALPREFGRDGRHRGGFRELSRDRSYSDDGSFSPRLPREWRDDARADRGGRRERRMTPIREVTLGGPATGGGRTMCVRLCDGYTFPLGRMRSGADVEAHQTACNSACPGAQTALYRLGSGATASKPDKATAASDGSLYRQLATAFLYRKERVASCSCQGPDNIATRLPIDRDETLRRGDVVVDADGKAAVFDGVGAGQKTFTDFRDSPSLTKNARKQVDKVMGVSQREATARAFAERMRLAAADDGGPAVTVSSPAARTREAALRPAGTTAGSGGVQVRAFSVVTPSAGGQGIQPVGPAVYVIR